MSILLQISDPHFGTEQPLVAKALIELAQQQEPDLVILSGDITQRRAHLLIASARPYSRFQAITIFRYSIYGQGCGIPMHNTSRLLALILSPYIRHMICWWCASTPRAHIDIKTAKYPRRKLSASPHNSRAQPISNCALWSFISRWP
jgi:3',5'-cyclic AMP phosphodiesterase CpdA